MNVTQRIVGTGVALALAVGGFGVRLALREAADSTADRITEDAVDAATERYENAYEPPTTVFITVPDVTKPEVTAPEATEPATTAPAPTTTTPPADARPKGWPAGLQVVEGLSIESTSDLTGPSVVGTVAGDVPTVTEAVKAQLAASGFTVDATRSVGGVTTATGAEGEVTVLVSPVPEDPASVRVTYRVALA